MSFDKQKKYFLDSEGDQWYNRNSEVLDSRTNNLDVKFYQRYIKKKLKILEIGCSAGDKLKEFYKDFECECYGIDPSSKAINRGKEKYPYLNLQKGTADQLPYTDEFFDFVIFGFCLCMVDRTLLSKTVFEADRVLKNGGFLGISDFDTKIPTVRSYKHVSGLSTYKIDYSILFLSFPHFSLVDKYSFSHTTDKFVEDPSERIGSILLYKNHEYAYNEFIEKK